MLKTIVLCIFIAEISRDLTECKPQYRNSYILHYNGSLEQSTLLEITKAGYRFEGQVVPGFFKFVADETGATLKTAKANNDDFKKLDKKVLWFKQEEVYFRSKRSIPMNRKRRAVTISDANWSDQWHLDPGHTPSMGVYNVWEKGITGQGVTVAIVDDGIDTTHVDLVDNYDASLSYDYISQDNNPSHASASDKHGTNCAGIVAAAKNGHCVIGIAYESKIPAIRILDSAVGATASQEASALIHELGNIDIYSNSWGPIDDGAGYESSDGISSIQETALLKGVTEGRNGKGAIYTWAAGNGGGVSDDCNIDGYANTIYTVSITSLAPDTSPAWYAEECTAVLAAAYGGDDTQDRIATTDPGDQCRDDFQGTSAACPVAAGIIALVLHANPQLSWRDIQHMIVEHSINTGLTSANFYSNAVGKQVSLSHGFGLLNAEAMVGAAPAWVSVPTQVICEGARQSVYRSSTAYTSITSTWTSNGCSIKYLEHVYININFKSLYRERTEIYLKSPGGTESRILRERPNDAATGTVSWKFMSVHTWGENPSGTWTLRMDSSTFRNSMTLNTWSLTFYGTETDPYLGTPEVHTLSENPSETSTVGMDSSTSSNSMTLSTSSPSFYETETEDVKDNTAAIVGAVIGAIIGMAIIGVGVFFVVKQTTLLKATASVEPTNTGQTQAASTESARVDQGPPNESYIHKIPT